MVLSYSQGPYVSANGPDLKMATISKTHNTIQASAALQLLNAEGTDSRPDAKPAEPQQASHSQYNEQKQNGATGDNHPVSNNSGSCPGSNAVSKAAMDVQAAMQHILEQEQDTETAADSTEPGLSLEGTACLAWLPDGRLTGSIHLASTTHCALA